MNYEVEVKRKPGRPRTKERITAAEAREKERLRGIARRADAKVRESMSEAETIEQFWAESRKLLDAAKLAEWQARQEYVEALLGDIRTVLEGRSPDEEFVEDVDDEIQEGIKIHGVAGITVPLQIGQFWKDPALLPQLTSGDTPSTIFARFGILTAVSDYTQHRWEQ